MSDHSYLLLLRLLHIGCGVLWAGGAIFLAFFIDPAVKASGPEGIKVMQQIVKTNRFPVVMMLLAVITILAGMLLIWKVSGGLQPAWMSSKNGIVLTSGAALALIAFLIGFSVNRPSGIKIAKIGKEIAASGGAPTPAQIEQLNIISRRLSRATKVIAFLLIFAVVGMSIFRYF
jgi:uncharacterized membrane protein